MYHRMLFSHKKYYFIAIPTYNRPEGLLHKTLSTLHKHCIDSCRIYLFVNDVSQRELYRSVIPRDMYGKIIVTGLEKSICKVRNFISSYFDMGQYYIMMDDDVVGIQTITPDGTKLQEVSNLHTLILASFRRCESLGYTLWGLYPVANPFYMKTQREFTTDLRFIVGGFMGIINRKRTVSLDWKEDYELSILAYLHDGGVLRYGHIAVNHHLYTQTGGIGKSQSERLQDYEMAADTLIERYPTLVIRNKRRAGEIRLKKGY